MADSPECPINVAKKWETCHIPNVRNGQKRLGTSLPGHDRLLIQLTAPPAATHTAGEGRVHHPGRRENRRRGTSALGSSGERTDARRSADLRRGPGAATATGLTVEGCMSVRPTDWKRRTILISSTLALVLSIPPIAVGASAVGRGPTGVLPGAQAPSHFAVIANERAEARRIIAPATTASAVQRQRVLMRAQMLEFTTTSPKTTDMRGIEPSLYRGDFFDPRLEEQRACIVKRESEGRYDVRGGAGDRYFGAYQMNDDLADGATWMMLEEHKRILGAEPARELMEELRRTPVTQWPRYWQDAAFYTIYNWEGSGSGAAHWAGGRWSC